MGAPLEDSLQRLIGHFAGAEGLIVYECIVEAQNDDDTVDVRPVSQALGDGMQHVPVALLGPFSVKVQPGGGCLLAFLNEGMERPMVIAFLPGTVFTEVALRATLKIEFLAPTLKIGDTSAAIEMAGSTQPVIRVGDTVTLGNPPPAPSFAGVAAVGGVPSTVKA